MAPLVRHVPGLRAPRASAYRLPRSPARLRGIARRWPRRVARMPAQPGFQLLDSFSQRQQGHQRDDERPGGQRGPRLEVCCQHRLPIRSQWDIHTHHNAPPPPAAAPLLPSPHPVNGYMKWIALKQAISVSRLLLYVAW